MPVPSTVDVTVLISSVLGTYDRAGGCLVLEFRQVNDDAVDVTGQRDLTGKPGGGLPIRIEVEHGFLCRRRRGQFALPWIVNCDMAGRARALATAVSVDTRYQVARGNDHQAVALISFDNMLCAIVLNKLNGGHYFTPWYLFGFPGAAIIGEVA